MGKFRATLFTQEDPGGGLRSFEEIEADVSAACTDQDVDALARLATELDAVGTPLADALASRSRGVADYLRSNNSSALEHSKRALELYDTLGDRTGMAHALNDLGVVYDITGRKSAALEYFDRALALFGEVGDRVGMASALVNIGILHSDLEEHAKALEQYRRSLAIYEELGNERRVAVVTGNMGIVYMSTGDYTTALDHFRRSMAIGEQLNDRIGVAFASGNIGLIHANLGEPDEALNQARRALALFEELEIQSGVAATQTNIGAILADKGQYDEALACFHRALDLREAFGDSDGVARTTGSVIGTYLLMGSNAEAEALLATLDQMAINDPEVRIVREHHRATLLQRAGDLEAAEAALQQALGEARQCGLRSKIAELHRALRELALKRNDLAGYVEHNNEYTRITEEIRGREVTQRMAMMAAERKMESELRERDKERALLYGALPEAVATRLLQGETVEDHYENAAVLFADIVGFTTHTSALHPSETIKVLEDLYKHFDALCAEHGVTKVKTIGDSYLCFAHEGNGESGMGNGAAERIAAVALAMQNADFYWPTAPANSNSEQLTASANSNSEQLTANSNSNGNGNRIKLRIGIHSGPVSAGVIGTERLQYDIWGDTVNVASRMESTGEPGRIQVSSAFAEQLRLLLAVAEKEGTANSNSQQQQKLTERGEVSVKGKGTMTTYWLEGTT